MLSYCMTYKYNVPVILNLAIASEGGTYSWFSDIGDVSKLSAAE